TLSASATSSISTAVARRIARSRSAASAGARSERDSVAVICSNSRLITCGAPFGSSRAGREASGTHRARHPPALERRRRRQAGHLEDLLLVERIALEQRLHERVQLAAMLAQQA